MELLWHHVRPWPSLHHDCWPCAFTYFIVSFIFCSFCFYVWFSVKNWWSDRKTNKIISMNPLFVCSVCLPLWLAKPTNKLFQLCVLLGELLHSDSSWWWQRRTELIPFQQLDVSFCFCLFEVEPCVGLFFCFVCFLKSLFLWISDHYHPLPLSVCVQSCPHPQTYWYLAFIWRQSY